MTDADFIYRNTPNFSMRMTAISAILVRNQLNSVDHKISQFNDHWWFLFDNLNGYDYHHSELGCNIRIEVAPRVPNEEIVGTSFLFNVMVEGTDDNDKKYKTLEAFSKLLSEHGISNAWYGRRQCIGFTSTFKHWDYISNEVIENNHDSELNVNGTGTSSFNGLSNGGVSFNSNDSNRMDDNSYNLPTTDSFLSTLFDIPLYHTSSWTLEDFAKICMIIKNIIRCTNI